MYIIFLFGIFGSYGLYIGGLQSVDDIKFIRGNIYGALSQFFEINNMIPVQNCQFIKINLFDWSMRS